MFLACSDVLMIWISKIILPIRHIKKSSCGKYPKKLAFSQRKVRSAGIHINFPILIKTQNKATF